MAVGFEQVKGMTLGIVLLSVGIGLLWWGYSQAVAEGALKVT